MSFNANKRFSPKNNKKRANANHRGFNNYYSSNRDQFNQQDFTKDDHFERNNQNSTSSQGYVSNQQQNCRENSYSYYMNNYERDRSPPRNRSPPRSRSPPRFQNQNRPRSSQRSISPTRSRSPFQYDRFNEPASRGSDFYCVDTVGKNNRASQHFSGSSNFNSPSSKRSQKQTPKYNLYSNNSGLQQSAQNGFMNPWTSFSNNSPSNQTQSNSRKQINQTFKPVEGFSRQNFAAPENKPVHQPNSSSYIPAFSNKPSHQPNTGFSSTFSNNSPHQSNRGFSNNPTFSQNNLGPVGITKTQLRKRQKMQKVLKRRLKKYAKNMGGDVASSSNTMVDLSSDPYQAVQYLPTRGKSDRAKPVPSKFVFVKNVSEFTGAPTENVTEWLDEIEASCKMQKKGNKHKIGYLQSRINGAARAWYRGLKDTKDWDWYRWTHEITNAFPAVQKYDIKLQQMMSCNMEPTDSIEKYFSIKLAMLNACEIYGPRAVACLIGGLPPSPVQQQARSKNFKTTDELYEFLLQSQGLTSNAITTNLPLKKKYDKVSKKPPHQCYSCRRMGHTFLTCNFLGNAYEVPDNYVSEKPPIDENMIRCFVCQELGHHGTKCFQQLITGQDYNYSVIHGNLIISVPNTSVFPMPRIHIYIYQKFFVDVIINGVCVKGYVDFDSEEITIPETHSTLMKLPMVKTYDRTTKGIAGRIVDVLGEVKLNVSIDSVAEDIMVCIIPNAEQKIPVVVGKSFLNKPDVFINTMGPVIKFRREKEDPATEYIKESSSDSSSGGEEEEDLSDTTGDCVLPIEDVQIEPEAVFISESPDENVPQEASNDAMAIELSLSADVKETVEKTAAEEICVEEKACEMKETVCKAEEASTLVKPEEELNTTSDVCTGESVSILKEIQEHLNNVDDSAVNVDDLNSDLDFTADVQFANFEILDETSTSAHDQTENNQFIEESSKNN